MISDYSSIIVMIITSSLRGPAEERIGNTNIQGKIFHRYPHFSAFTERNSVQLVIYQKKSFCMQCNTLPFMFKGSLIYEY